MNSVRIRSFSGPYFPTLEREKRKRRKRREEKEKGRFFLCAIIASLVKMQIITTKVTNDHDENKEFHKKDLYREFINRYII